MAGSLIVPMTLSAKVMKAPFDVPSLDGPVFNRSHKLEKGVHLHWALPDSLTKAKVIKKNGVENGIFPGVPDLWLVLRLNQAPPINGPVQKLTWKAWVVDSIAPSVTPLDTWTPPNRDPKIIHTMAGALESADSLGFKAYGLWDKNKPKFDPTVAAYYPACRTRLGFYDSLAGIAPTGKISYTVIGWYSLREHDPLYMTLNTGRLLRRWKLGYSARPKTLMELATSTVLTNAAPAPAWMPAAVQSAIIANPSAAKITEVKRTALRGGSKGQRLQQIREMEQRFPMAPKAPDGPVQETIQSLVHDNGPKDILCHGSVLDVDLAGPADAPVQIVEEDIKLYPSVKRAIADIAAKNADEKQIEYVEMMLQDLDSLKNSVAGVLDLPGTAHALTFQNVPGKSQYYAKVDIHPKPPANGAYHFDNSKSPYVTARMGSGYWPYMIKRSASVSSPAPSLAGVPASVLRQPTPSASPDEAELAPWRADFRAAFEAAKTGAAGQQKELDARLVRVQDYRHNAQPLQLGRSADGNGPDNASWWIDINDDAALNELYKSVGGCIVHLPHDVNLHNQPGPRWYRPWSPQIVLHGTKRSYKFGEDGRFRSDRFVNCRTSGETTVALSVGNRPPVYGRDILDNPSMLFSTAAIPPEAQSLINESALINPEAAGILANLSMPRAGGENKEAVKAQYTTAIRSIMLSRSPRLSASDKKLIVEKVIPWGELGAAEGTMLWQDPRDPLFIDANYSHMHSPLETHWELKQDWVECTQVDNAPPPVEIFELKERTPVTASLTKTLESALITRKVLDLEGNFVKAQNLPEGLKEDTFQQMDLISAPLTHLETEIFGKGIRERSGAVRLNKLDLVDIFGIYRPWNSGHQPTQAGGGPTLSYWADLPPRLPYWSRVNFRLQSAKDVTAEASPIHPPVCGLLLPDFMEHAIEVFDGEGKAIGQLTSDRPQFGSGPNGADLQVHFELHPWVAQQLNLPPGSKPSDGIENEILRGFVQALENQNKVVTPNQPGGLFETGLTAVLRVIDTVRGTLDPSVKTRDRKTHLIGEPMMLVAAKLQFEGADISSKPDDLAKNPQILSQSPAMPTISVRIGDVTRTDDGVLGCFVPEDGPGQPARFFPVSTQAATEAIFNGLVNGTEYSLSAGMATAHEFVGDHEAKFDLEANTPKTVYILADVRGSLYATAGALPRKKITVPKEFLEPALKAMEPTFRVGPILTFMRKGQVRPVLPPPEIEGFDAEFVFQEQGSPTFAEVGVPAAPPVSELPVDRVRLHEGWVRMFKGGDPQA